MTRRSSPDEPWRSLLVLGLWVAVFLAPKAFADPEIPRERHATILVKALSYDEKLKNRAGEKMVVAVLYPSGDHGAADEAEAWRQAFANLSSLRFLGLPFGVVTLPLGNAERLRKAIAKDGIDAVFVLADRLDDLAWIKKVTRESKVLTMASRQEQITAGLSLGVFLIDGKNALFVNLTASLAEGAVFSSAMLKLARVVK